MFFCSQKQAQVEQRKHDEKARREQIFQDYLKRKAEREKAEQDARGGGGAAPVSRRNKIAMKARNAPRPKSQPMFAHDALATASSSHSSQEDVRGRSPGADRLAQVMAERMAGQHGQ